MTLNITRDYASTRFVGEEEFEPEDPDYPKYFRRATISGGWSCTESDLFILCGTPNWDYGAIAVSISGGLIQYSIDEGSKTTAGTATTNGWSNGIVDIYSTHPQGQFAKVGALNLVCELNPFNVTENLSSTTSRVFGTIQASTCGYPKVGESLLQPLNANGFTGEIRVELSEEDRIEDAIQYANGRGGSLCFFEDGCKGKDGINAAYSIRPPGPWIDVAALNLDATFEGCAGAEVDVVIECVEYDIIAESYTTPHPVVHLKNKIFDSSGRLEINHSLTASNNKVVAVKDIYAISAGSCSTSGGHGYSTGRSNNSVHWYTSIGKIYENRIAGQVRLDRESWADLQFNPADLRLVNLGASSVSEIWDNGKLKQVLTSEDFLNVQTNSPTDYQIDLYPAPAAVNPDPVTGVYAIDPNVPPHSSHLIEKIVTGTEESLRITERLVEVDGGNLNYVTTRISEFSYENGVNPGEGVWTLEEGDTLDQGQLDSARRTVVTKESIDEGVYQGCTLKTSEVWDDNDTLSPLKRKVSKIFTTDTLGFDGEPEGFFYEYAETFDHEILLQEQYFTDDSASPEYTVTYDYGTVAGQGNYRRLIKKEDSRGPWEKRTYHADGSLHKIIRPWLNSEITDPESSHEVLETTLTTLTVAPDGVDGQLQTRSRSVQGQPVRKSFTLTYSDLQTISGISISREDSITGATPSANWNSAENRVVSEWKYADEASEFYGETYAIVNADGTGTVRLLSRDGQDNLVVTERSGAIVDPSAPLLINAGTETVHTYSGSVQLIDKETTDFASGLVVASETYSNFDALGRPQRIDYLDGTYETRQYACCGLDSVTGRDGVQTTYGYDSLGRVEDTTNFAGTARQLVTRTIYDAAGNLKERLIGEDTTSLASVKENDYNLDGTLAAKRERYLDAEPSAAREQTESATTDAQGYRITTNTLANGTALIEKTYRDGNAYETSGTAVHGQRHAYGIELDTELGYYVQTHTLTALKVDGSHSGDYTKEFTNALGEVYRVERPAPDGGDPSATKYTYNAAGQLKVSEDPDGQLTLYDYNTLEQLEVTALDMDGDLEIDYDGLDRITRQIESFSTRTDGQDTVTVQRRTIEVWGTDNVDSPEIISQTDQSLSALGQTLPLSKTWSTQYGQLTTTTSTIDHANATVTRRSVYPDLSWEEQESVDGYLTRQTRADNLDATLSEQTFTYDAENRVYEIIDIHRGTTTTTYYGDGQVKSVLTPDPDSTQTGDGYDPQLTTYSYTDSLASGISRTTTLPDGISQMVETFHPTGELASREGALTYPVAYTYDHTGRLFTQTTWKDKATSTGPALTVWEYFPGGKLKQKWYNGVIDGSGVITGTEGSSYTWSDAGRLATRTNARGTVTTYTYDPDSKDLTDISHNDGITPGISYEYNREGRIQTVTDASGKRTLSYENGQLADESYVDDENPATNDPFLGLFIDRRQDFLGRFDQIRLLNAQQSELHKVGYGFDEASRLKTVTQGTDTATYAYYPASAIRQTVTFNNGTNDVLAVSRSFDDLDRQTSQTSALAGGPTKSYSYLYNDLNQRIRMILANGAYWQYGYDALGQVDSAVRKTNSDVAIPGYSYGFTFDDIGNRENATLNGRSADYTANLLNQYTERDIPRAVDVRGTANAGATVTVDGQSTTRTGDHFYRELDFSGETNPDDARLVEFMVTGTLPDGGYNNSPRIADAEGEAFLKANPESFVHDDDGNLTDDGRWSYTWNADNRLVTMQTLTGAATVGVENLRLEFAYDSQGRRFEKKVFAWDGQAYALQSTRRFLYDGWNLIAELDGQGGLVRGYAWGTDLSGTLQGAGGVGGLIFVSDTATGLNLIPFYDGNGNVMGYADLGAESIVAELEYGPFGETIMASGPMVNSLAFRFSTKYTDGETGLLYYGYRYYNPNTGRWLSRDPLGEVGHDLVAELFDTTGVDQEDKITPPNLYNFAFNDGINYYDVNGEWVAPALRGAGAAAGAIGRWWAKRKAKQAAECAAIHAAYDAAAKQAAGCKPCLTCPEYVKLLTARAAEIGGRALYLKKKCDYKLPGSIARGSKKAEAGHRKQLADKVKAFGNCAAHAAKQNCGNIPQLPKF